MNFGKFRKRAESTDYLVKWIITIAIIVAAGFAIKGVIGNYA